MTAFNVGHARFMPSLPRTAGRLIRILRELATELERIRMMNRRLFAPLVLIASLMISTPLISDETKPADKPAADKGAEKEKPPEPPPKLVRQHRLKVGGSEIAYTTTAEEIILKDGEGKSTARFFTIAYTKDGVTNSETRPVTFVFNGGPGSASIWLPFG